MTKLKRTPAKGEVAMLSINMTELVKRLHKNGWPRLRRDTLTQIIKGRKAVSAVRAKMIVRHSQKIITLDMMKVKA